MFWRLLLFVAVLASVSVHVWLFVALLTIYIIFYQSIESLVLAFCVDALFGASVAWPLFTIYAAVLLTLVWIGTPSTVFYTKE